MNGLVLGYQRLIDTLSLRVRPLARIAVASSAVNRKQFTATEIRFPSSVAYEDSPLGHLEFALRHEVLNLEVIAAVFDGVTAAMLCQRYAATPNGEFIRKACFLWEWMGRGALEQTARTTLGYVAMLDPDQYATAGRATRNAKYRIDDNLLGNSDFCPTISRQALDASSDLLSLLESIERQLQAIEDPDLYTRAVQYLFLSETKGSFAIERETASGGKEERFVQLLAHAGAEDASEEWLVELQNAVVRDDFSKEASFRTRQNWLEDRNARLTYLPPSPAHLRRLMNGWERFTNDSARAIPLAAKLACGAFGFVYLHPFMDGNGRLHRFMIHHILARSNAVRQDTILPVSATILKQMMREYDQVLNGFSRPVTRLWDYIRADDGPAIRFEPGPAVYAYFNADAELGFLVDAIRRTVDEEIPRELRFLVGFDEASERIDGQFDLRGPDIGALVRMIHGNRGALSRGKRKQFSHLPDSAIERIESIVRDSFVGEGWPIKPAGPGS